MNSPQMAGRTHHERKPAMARGRTASVAGGCNLRGEVGLVLDRVAQGLALVALALGIAGAKAAAEPPLSARPSAVRGQETTVFAGVSTTQSSTIAVGKLDAELAARLAAGDTASSINVVYWLAEPPDEPLPAAATAQERGARLDFLSARMSALQERVVKRIEATGQHVVSEPATLRSSPPPATLPQSKPWKRTQTSSTFTWSG